MMPPRLFQRGTRAARLLRRGNRDRSLQPRASKTAQRAAAAAEKKSKTDDRSAFQPRPRLLPFSLSLFAAGAALGPPLDGIHGAFGLLQYDLAPILIGDDLGALHTALTVPALLGTFYAANGLLHVWGDEFFLGAKQTRLPLLPPPRPGPALAACALALVVSQLTLSALLYDSQTVPADRTALALSAAAFGVWLALDRTATGAALALATALAAPLTELVLMNLFGVWHYPRADFFLTALGDEKGIVSWVPACYAGYSVWIGALARWWWCCRKEEDGE